MSAPGCREIAELLPWWANGSLAGAERAAVEAHLELCAKCRRELERCETERAALRAEASAAPMPHPAQLDRLFARIDAGETGDDDAPPRGGATRGLFARTPRPVRWLLAAQLALVAVGGIVALVKFQPAAVKLGDMGGHVIE